MAFELINGEIFLHTPKTGGNFIEKALNELGLVKRKVGWKHWDVTRLIYRERLAWGKDVMAHFCRKRLSRSYRSRTSSHAVMFAFVRNPFGWYESYWRFMMGREHESWGAASRASREPPSHWWAGSLGALDPLFDRDFEVFVRNVLRHRPGFVTELYGFYDQFPVSFIGRQESLVADLAGFLRQRGYDVTEKRLRAVPPVNQSKAEIPQPDWPEDLRVQVALTEFPGFVRYGYFDQLPEVVKALHPAVGELDRGPRGCPTIAGYTSQADEGPVSAPDLNE